MKANRNHEPEKPHVVPIPEYNENYPRPNNKMSSTVFPIKSCKFHHKENDTIYMEYKWCNTLEPLHNVAHNRYADIYVWNSNQTEQIQKEILEELKRINPAMKDLPDSPKAAYKQSLKEDESYETYGRFIESDYDDESEDELSEYKE